MIHQCDLWNVVQAGMRSLEGVQVGISSPVLFVLGTSDEQFPD